MDSEANNDNLSAKALEDRSLILEALAQRFTRKKMLERRNPDGSLAYRDFLDRMGEKQEIPIRIIKPNSNL